MNNLIIQNVEDFTQDVFDDDFRSKTGEIIGLNNLSESIEMNNAYFFKICEISYDSDFPRREAFENVLGILDQPSFNFVYMLSGKPEGVDIILGVVKNKNINHKGNAYDYGSDFLHSTLIGNFQGTKTERFSRKEIEKNILTPLKDSKNVSLITGIPSLNLNEDENDFQGIDRLINSMNNDYWQLLIVCEPVAQSEINKLKKRVYNLYNELYTKSEVSIQHSKGVSINESKSTSRGSSKSKSKGVSSTEGSSSGYTSSHSTSSDSSSKGTNNSTTKSSSTNHSKSESETESDSIAITKSAVNKEIQELLKYLDEELLEKIKLGSAKELYKTSIYALAKNKVIHEKLEWLIMSIFQGESITLNELKPIALSKALSNDDREKMLCNFQIPQTEKILNEKLSLIYARPSFKENDSLSTYMTAKEVSIIAGLPMKEVPGISLHKGVDFGLNADKNKKGIEIGNILQRGRVLKNNKIFLDKDIINKHLFIAGVTGSGKTTTCHKILMESNLPFLVIEPAKTEYRELINKNGMENLKLFTLGNDKLAPFRLNPFELLEGESITSHIDMIKAVFSAAFPMEAAMPQILEAAIYQAYENYGWDFDTNENIYCESPWKGNGQFNPTFDDLIVSLKNVIKTRGFGKELESNYIGALISRISNLTIGSKGNMLNCKKSLDFDQLINEKVIMELDELKSGEDKALVIGFILMRLTEVLKRKHIENNDFRHITLVEEAHRLLSRINPNDSGAKKYAVEMFSDLLSEVRKYGEGFIIVDQIPSKLALDVIKNTNTKIIHKIFAKDDKDIVGDTMSMNEEQKSYLSKLDVGETIIYSQNWNNPINVKVNKVSETNSEDICESEIMKLGMIQIELYKDTFFPELMDINIELTKKQVEYYYFKRKKIFKLIVIMIRDLIFNGDIVKKIVYLVQELNQRLFGDKTRCILNNHFDLKYQLSDQELELLDGLLIILVEGDIKAIDVFVNKDNNRTIAIKRLSEKII